MKDTLRAFVLSTASLGATSCILVPGGGDEPAAVPVKPNVEIQVIEPESPPAPVLYARDGSAVSATASSTETTSVPSTVEPVRRIGGEGSRMYLLELYQQVIEERDGLRTELAGMGATLEKEHAARQAAVAEIEKWKAQVTALETRLEELDEKNRELAARLVSAQIGRLEAEKLLLEAKLSWQAVQEVVSDDAQTGANR